MKTIDFKGKKVSIGSIRLDGVDWKDYPDFCDAYICKAKFEDGIELTEDELEEFQEENEGLAQELAIEDSQRRREYEREAKNEDNYWRQVQAETGLPVHHG